METGDLPSSGLSSWGSEFGTDGNSHRAKVASMQDRNQKKNYR
jgi:hypothetical protein